MADPLGANTPPDEMITALPDSGAWRLLQPTRNGGRGLTVDEFVSVVSELAPLDGSAGWLTAMFNAAAYHIGELGGDVADDVWSGDAKSFVAVCYWSDGLLNDDGRLSGRWPLVAGCRHADWLLLSANADGKRCCVLVPRRDADIETTRNETGLLAAELSDVTVSGLPVPERRIVQSPRGPAALVIGAGAATAVVGAADGVWRNHVDQVRERLAASYGTEEVTDRMSSTTEVARAASDIDAAKLQIAQSLHRTDAARAHRQAAVRGRDAADRLLGSSRRHALDTSDPVTRLWQDVHAACRLTLRLLDGIDPG